MPAVFQCGPVVGRHMWAIRRQEEIEASFGICNSSELQASMN